MEAGGAKQGTASGGHTPKRDLIYNSVSVTPPPSTFPWCSAQQVGTLKDLPLRVSWDGVNWEASSPRVRDSRHRPGLGESWPGPGVCAQDICLLQG